MSFSSLSSVSSLLCSVSCLASALCCYSIRLMSDLSSFSGDEDFVLTALSLLELDSSSIFSLMVKKSVSVFYSWFLPEFLLPDGFFLPFLEILASEASPDCYPSRR